MALKFDKRRDSITMSRPNIKTIQNRIANTSIGSSALRNQGAKGVIPKAREYCKEINMNDFLDVSESNFNDLLNEHTKCLERKLPKGAQNWGAARKALSVFLEAAFYDKFLSKEYHFDRIEKFLELPADKYVYEGLKKYKAVVPGFPKGGPKAIKYQDSTYIDEIQAYASLVAKHNKTSRIFLDLEFWRSAS